VNEDLEVLMNWVDWRESYEVQRATVQDFHARCANSLGASCGFRPPDDQVLRVERNLFSTLFVLATKTLGLPERAVRFYAMVNQCMRALVTGCDNLLDDEFKEVIPFDLPGDGTKFRSVLTIMTADRVLFELALDAFEERLVSADHAKKLARKVLDVLMPSGIEEHEEEAGKAIRIYTPAEVSADIHYRKTGLLFEAPLTLIQEMGGVDPGRCKRVNDALCRVGLACQALDDIKDTARDLERAQCNMVISYALHGDVAEERDAAAAFLEGREGAGPSADCAASELTTARSRTFAHALRLFGQAERLLCANVPGLEPIHATALTHVIMGALGFGLETTQRRAEEQGILV
jgi:hypothetical protein